MDEQGPSSGLVTYPPKPAEAKVVREESPLKPAEAKVVQEEESSELEKVKSEIETIKREINDQNEVLRLAIGDHWGEFGSEGSLFRRESKVLNTWFYESAFAMTIRKRAEKKGRLGDFWLLERKLKRELQKYKLVALWRLEDALDPEKASSANSLALATRDVQIADRLDWALNHGPLEQRVGAFNKEAAKLFNSSGEQKRLSENIEPPSDQKASTKRLNSTYAPGESRWVIGGLAVGALWIAATTTTIVTLMALLG